MKKIYLVSSPDYADEQAYLCIYRKYADEEVEVTQSPSQADIKVYPCGEGWARQWKYRFLYVTNESALPQNLKRNSRTFW